MDILSQQEAEEITLRMMTEQTQLKELTSRYVKAEMIAIAAHGAMNDPAKANPEWAKAEVDFFAAAAIYRTASDALTVFLSSDLWAEYGDKVGRHLLRLCEAWEKMPKDRETALENVRKMQSAITSLPLVKPKDGFSAKQIRMQRLEKAMEESGWEEEADEQENRRARVKQGGVNRLGAHAEEPRAKKKAISPMRRRER